MLPNKINNYILYLLLVVCFNYGLLEILGINQSSIRVIIDILIVIIIFNNFLKKISWLYISSTILLLISLSIVSFLINDISLLQFILFVRIYIMPILFFISLKNIKNINFIKLEKLIDFLFIEQIIASILKLIISGNSESYIGTISVSSGELATIVPLLGISYFFLKYLYYNNRKYLFICPFFLIISYSSLKLGTIVYLPIILLGSYLIWFNSQKMSSKYLIKFLLNLFRYIIFLILILYFLVRLNPRANKEKKIWGSFDIQYVYNYYLDYTSKFRMLDEGIQSGRFSATIIYFEDIKEGTLKNILFGKGPGSIIKTGLIENNYRDFKEKYGYGSKVGLIWIIEQVGFLSLLFFVLFQIQIYRLINKLSFRDNFFKNYSKVIIVILFLDIITYSSSFLTNPSIMVFYYVLLNIGLNYNREIIGKK